VRKTISILVACLVTAGLFGIACKKNDPEKMRYSITSKDKILDGYAFNKEGKRVLWIQIIDQVDNKAAIDSYKKSTVKIENYPAMINKNEWIFLLVNDRIEVHLFADKVSKDFQDADELMKFIKLFDLAGMEKISGPRVKGEVLEKFLPKLGPQK